MFTPEFFYNASTWIVPVLLAITLHEAAHAWVAWKLGDNTAYKLGRVTFNPIRHIDPFGTVILPGLLFMSGSPFLIGWAKPVPVVFRKLRNPRIGMVKVAIAGPATNIVLALASALLFHLVQLLPPDAARWSAEMLLRSIQLNIVLAVFNMFPIPPLDGGRVAVGLLPDVLARPLARLERYGMSILIGLIIVLPFIGRQTGMNLDVFGTVLRFFVGLLVPPFLTLAGLR